ncbi:MAG: Protein-disulfide reductase [Planctomycetaceae bacterium]|nr:Protein-disulfide reductase [Planctomycetaceae bacterium]
MNMNLQATGHRSLSMLSLAFLCALGTYLSPIAAQDLNGFKDPLGLQLPGQQGVAAPEPKVTIAVEPAKAQSGETVTFSVTIELPPGSYTYSMSPKFGGGTKVKFTAEEGVKALGDFKPDHPPKVEFAKEFDQNVEKFTKSVTWSRQYEVIEAPNGARLQGNLIYQVCDSMSCRNLRKAFDIEIPQSDGTGESSPVAKRGVAENQPTTADADHFLINVKKKTPHSQGLIRLTPVDAQPGDEVSLELQVKMDPKWHVYSLTQPEGNTAETTTIEIESHQGLEAIDAEFTANKPFERQELDDVSGKKKLIHEIYEHEVTWTRKFRLLPGTQLSDVKVIGKARYQVCKDGGSCVLHTQKFELPRGGDVAPEKPAVTIVPVAEPGVPTSPSKGPQMADLSDAECAAGAGHGDAHERGFFYVIGAAFVFGWLALLTPCVFPMVPITVSFFLKQAEKKHNNPLKMAFVYCGSIIATFTVMGLLFSFLFGAGYINTLANGVYLNLFLGLVLLFFALNLLGLFDIQIPSWLLTFTASKESTSSYLGVFFMALTFTLTSFTCTFAFLGLILVWAANGEFWLPLAGLVSFSTAFALPFFLLALFPSYLQKLPKSGGWMNRVKVVMGLIEMAFMFKFLSVADISWNGTPTVFDYHLVMSAWMAISLVTGLYLIGKITLPHDTREDYIGVLPMVLAIGCFGLAGYLAVGIFGHEPPSGILGKQILAFAPPRLEGGTGEDGPFLIGSHDKQTYLLDFERAKAKAQKLQQPLFIDFTGVNCINCRKMEELMASSSIQQHLKNFVRVQLYTDQMPSNAVSDAKLGEKLLQQNINLQEDWYKDASLPGYAVVTPDGKVFLSRIQGLVPAADFETFLQCGENKWELSKRAEVASTKQ